jgi:hypothetical protein
LIYLFLYIALHVSGGSSAHHQEHKTVDAASGIVKPILLPAAIVDEMELRWNRLKHAEKCAEINRSRKLCILLVVL